MDPVNAEVLHHSHTDSKMNYTTTVFLRSDSAATIYFVAHFVGLLFEGGIYFFEKPGDIQDSWIRYLRVRRWWLLDAVSSTCSLSVLLSAVEMTRTTQIALALVWWLSAEIIRTRVPLFFCSRVSDCSATIRRRRLFEEIRYMTLCSTLNWQPLSLRRKLQKLKVCYNIVNNRSIIPSSTFSLHPRPSPHYPHSQILYKPFVKTSSHMNSFLFLYLSNV